MITLAEMLDEADANDLIMKAELFRELGRFGDARVLLSKSINKDLSQAVEIIKSLVGKSDRCVREMQFK